MACRCQGDIAGCLVRWCTATLPDPGALYDPVGIVSQLGKILVTYYFLTKA